LTRIAAFFISLLCIAGLSFSYSAEKKLLGIIGDAIGRKPLTAATIIIQGYKDFGGKMFQDSAFSDSQGKFQLTLHDSDRYTPSVLVEKDGYKTRTVTLPTTGSQNIMLDTVFMIAYTLQDSLTYSVSGAISDTADQGIRGAIVSVTLSRGAAAFFSVKDTTSQWGGYFNVKTRQQYQKSPVTVHLHVEKTGFLIADTSQTFSSSTQDFVLYYEMKKNLSAVLPMTRLATRKIATSTLSYSADGRYCGTNRMGAVSRIVIRVSKDGYGRTHVQLR
jgi:hypothetical protein